MNRDHELSVLLDKQSIRELVYRYCRGLDRLDEATLRAIYHADAIEDRGPGLFVGKAHDFIPVVLKTLQKYYLLSQHFIGNCLIDIEGDVAYGESYFSAYHRLPDKSATPGDAPVGREMIMSGRYLDRFERRDGVWKIAHRKMVNDWTRTQPVAEKWFESNPAVHRSMRAIADSRLG
jgi:hypothetical protein